MSETSAHSELFRGASTLAVLSLLRQGPAHGYALTEMLRDQTGGVIKMSEGAIYPILHRLERRGTIRSHWVRGTNNRRVKVYSLTPFGSDWLEQAIADWKVLAAAMVHVLENETPPPQDQVIPC